MKTEVSKVPLDFNLYEKFEIPQEYAAYKLEFSNVTEQECEDLEFDYSSKGYRVFFSEVNRAKEGLFNMILIVAKSEFTF